MNDIELWVLRGLWLVLPLTAGPVFDAALVETERLFRVGSTIGLWVGWGALLIVLMIPRTATLTAVRIAVPAAAALFLWAVIAAGGDVSTTRGVVGSVSTAATLAWSLRSSVSDRLVDGSSYGDETRFLLRTPAALLLGPLLGVWAFTVAGMLAGPLLLLAGRWLVGAVATAVGLPIAYLGVKTIHRLSERWLVFVPAGVVVHDKTALREPQLFRTADVSRFGAAPADADEEDLSLDGLGLALRVQLTAPSKVMRNSRGETVETTDIDGFIVAPNRPGAVLEEASERGFVIG